MADPAFDKDGNLTNLSELTPEEVATAYQEKNRQQHARAVAAEQKAADAEAARLKAEQERDALKPAPTPPAPPVVSAPQPSIPELRLMMGLSDEAIAEANDIAKGKGITFKEALETPVFKAYQATEKAKKDAEDAQLPASQGSGQYVPPEGIKPGQTKEEHEDAWRKAAGLPPIARAK